MLFLLTNQASAQNAPITEVQLMYTRSNLYGVNLNSHKSWGAYYRLGWHKTGKKQNHWEIDIIRIKQPNEIRRTGFTEAQAQYSFGRMNMVFFMRNSFGQTITITDRPYKNAVGLNFVYNVGITAAFLKPIYLEIFYPFENTPGYGYLVSEKYDKEKHSDVFRIHGNASNTKGISETTIELGGFGRAGFQVEFGQYSDELRSLEAGITLDGFVNPIPIVALANNDFDRIFWGFYVAYNFGSRK
jgi:hypothetical protein